MLGCSWVTNPNRDPGWTCRRAPAAVRDFHRSLPEYAPTRLADLPDLARTLGVARVFAKDESNRLGHRVAVFVPDGVRSAAVQAIRDEGAGVSHIAGDYDAAVHAAARAADAANTILVQDMAWDTYEDIPGLIVDGYATLFAELDDQLREQGIARPDLVVVPAGVGSLLQAALTHYRNGITPPGAVVVSVEPRSAACVLASVTADHPVTVATGTTSMAGLNCGTVSSLAWPHILRGLDGCIAVEDAQVAGAARELAELGVDAGPCGAAPLAALYAVHDDAGAFALAPTSTVVLLVTEGSAANPADGRQP